MKQQNSYETTAGNVLPQEEETTTLTRELDQESPDTGIHEASMSDVPFRCRNQP